jgi:amino acid transporter
MTIDDAGFLGELRLGRRLTTTARVAARGLAVVLGLLFLVPGRIFEQVGVISTGASLLAMVIVGLTLLSVFELLGGSSEQAGTYTLIHETLGGPIGFLAGWLLLAGSVALSVALLKISTNSFLMFFPQLKQSVSIITLGVFAALVLIQLFHLLPRRELLRPVVIVLLLMIDLERMMLSLHSSLVNSCAQLRYPSCFMPVLKLSSPRGARSRIKPAIFHRG